MNGTIEIPQEEVDRVYEHVNRIAEKGGYHLNPNAAFTKELIHGMLVNGRRYGYWACPCRLADGEREEDFDIICPCVYRDADVLEYGACYCALYVSKQVLVGKRVVESIPERRPPEAAHKVLAERPVPAMSGISHPVWRCSVCGYLCAGRSAGNLPHLPGGQRPVRTVHRERRTLISFTALQTAIYNRVFIYHRLYHFFT